MTIETTMWGLGGESGLWTPTPASDASPLHEADNPALRAPRLDDPRPDPKVTYAVDRIPFGEYDADGCWWIVQETKGWHSAPGMKTARSNRPYGGGDWRSKSWRKSRIITLKGTVICPHVGARQAALDRLASLCSDGGQLQTLTVTDQLGRVRTADVELEGEPDVTVRHETRFDYQVQLAAPDPRKHGVWQDQVVNPLVALKFEGRSSLAGLDFGGSGSGLSFAGGGLSFGYPPTPGSIAYDSGRAQVANYGTEPAYPLFRIRDVLFPQIMDEETGAVLTITRFLDPGETVIINCDDFAARGYRGHAVWSSSVGNIRSALVVQNEWPVVQPGQVASYRLAGALGENSELLASVRSAWS